MHKRRDATRFLWVLLLTAPLMSGCVVVPIGDLFRPATLEEQVLVEGAGFFSKEKVAIVTVRGEIRGGDPSGGRSLFAAANSVEETKAQLDRIRRDPEVRAVVLRIASPGGEVTACDVIYNELVKFKKSTGMPLIASIGSQGASGGYYIACAADQIYANPTSIVGSIGVILQHFDASGLLAKIGIQSGPIKSGDKKDLNSFLRAHTPDEHAILQKLVDDMYARFVDVVQAGRPRLSREAVVTIADGRVVSGVQAQELGLVDAVGYLEDALEDARGRAGVGSPTYVRYARSPGRDANIYSCSNVEATSADFELRLRGSRSTAPQLSYLWQP